MEVKVYSTPTCMYCKLVKEFLSDKGVEYKEIDVSEDTEKMSYIVEATGQMGVPVIEIGEYMIVGFDQDKITELLKL